jgi:hypothetical protein
MTLLEMLLGGIFLIVLLYFAMSFMINRKIKWFYNNKEALIKDAVPNMGFKDMAAVVFMGIKDDLIARVGESIRGGKK